MLEGGVPTKYHPPGGDKAVAVRRMQFSGVVPVTLIPGSLPNREADMGGDTKSGFGASKQQHRKQAERPYIVRFKPP